MSSGVSVLGSRRLVLALILASSAVLLSPLFVSHAHAVQSIVGGAMRPGFNQTALPANDDGSTGLVPLGFKVNFFGTNYTDLYVNNNGDLTFDGPLATYTPFNLTSTRHVIVAPYFADVDTRVGNLLVYGNGTVNGHLAWGATWPGVGCFNQIDTVKDYFQVILIYRPDIGVGDFDIEFNYNSIVWEAGTASGGSSMCLGGHSSRVGFSAGTGVQGTYFELAGSGVNGAFLDSNNQTGLIHNSLNSSQLGRYIFAVRGGAPVIVPIVVTCSGPVTVGTPSTCAATVTDTRATPTTPTGTVSFTTDSQGSFTGSPCILAGSGSSATCHSQYTPSAVGSGTHTITATYSGDGSHAPSSGHGTLTVTGLAFDFGLSTPSPAGLTVVQGSSSPSASIDATLVSGTTAGITFSAAGLPSGVTAVFTNNSCSPTCTVTVSFSATTVATLGTTTVSIQAQGGGASHTTSLSLTVVAPAPHATGTTVTCTGPVVVGSPSTCTATVTDNDASPTTPGGTVSFTSNGSGSFTGSPCTPSGSGSTASCHVTYTPSAVGVAHRITGTYSGDSTHSGSSGSDTVTVVAIIGTSQFGCQPNPVNVNQPSTCTFFINDSSSNPTTPQGTVHFSTNSAGSFTPATNCTISQGSGPPGTASCQVTYTPSAVGSGVHTLNATYSGDSVHAAQSLTFGLTVKAAVTGQIDLTFRAFDCDDFDNGIGELSVLVNNQLVVNIPAGLHNLNGTGDYSPYTGAWASFGPFNIASFVTQGTNSIVFRNPLTGHGCKIGHVLIVQGASVLLDQSGTRSISPSHSVNYRFSNPPMSLTSFTVSPSPVIEFHQVTLNVTFTGGVGPFTCRFRFGDGRSATVRTASGSCSVTHTYRDDRTYNATVSVSGINTNDMKRGSALVHVLEDHPVVATALTNTSGSVNPLLAPSSFKKHSRNQAW